MSHISDTSAVVIERFDVAATRAALPQLVALLQETVAGGASIGFLPPVTEDEAHAYWAGVIAEIEQSIRILLVARREGAIVGTVQLELAGRKNATHRAEVQRLMVAQGARRSGIGGRLMTEIEEHARRAGRMLLVLDTRAGDAAESLYLRRGYTRVGVIPAYARSASGTLDPTVIFYRQLC